MVYFTYATMPLADWINSTHCRERIYPFRFRKYDIIFLLIPKAERINSFPTNGIFPEAERINAFPTNGTKDNYWHMHREDK